VGGRDLHHPRAELRVHVGVGHDRDPSAREREIHHGPDQGLVQSRGNKYLRADFPKMDYVKSAALFN